MNFEYVPISRRVKFRFICNAVIKNGFGYPGTTSIRGIDHSVPRSLLGTGTTCLQTNPTLLSGNFIGTDIRFEHSTTMIKGCCTINIVED